MVFDFNNTAELIRHIKNDRLPPLRFLDDINRILDPVHKNTLLHLIMMYGKDIPDMYRQVLNHGGSWQIPNASGYTPFYLAMIYNREQFFRAVISHLNAKNEDLISKNEFMEKSFQLTIKHKTEEIARMKEELSKKKRDYDELKDNYSNLNSSFSNLSENLRKRRRTD